LEYFVSPAFGPQGTIFVGVAGGFDVISGSTDQVVTTVSTPCVTEYLAYDAVNEAVYDVGDSCSDNASDSVFAYPDAGPGPLGSATVVPQPDASLCARLEPSAVWSYCYAAVDPSSGVVAVGCPDVVSLIGPFPLTFVVTSWALDFGLTVALSFPTGYGESVTSSDVTITMLVPNGSYAYDIRLPGGYVSSPSSGTVEVSGGPARVPVAVTFTWWVWVALGTTIGVAVVGVRWHRARTRARKAAAEAALRWDLEHPFVGKGEPAERTGLSPRRP